MLKGLSWRRSREQRGNSASIFDNYAGSGSGTPIDRIWKFSDRRKTILEEDKKKFCQKITIFGVVGKVTVVLRYLPRGIYPATS